MFPPRLYPIIDVACYPDVAALFAAAEEFAAACTLLQGRNKPGNTRQAFADAREPRAGAPGFRPVFADTGLGILTSYPPPTLHHIGV
jgi:hypothetical protein